MEFNLNNILKEFDIAKTMHDVSDYLNDMKKIDNVLKYYERHCAIELVRELTTKYQIGLDKINLNLNTGRSVIKVNNYTNQQNQINEKTDVQLIDDLNYLYMCIPLIALLKFGVKKLIFGGIV